jgi:hypothetical protein
MFIKINEIVLKQLNIFPEKMRQKIKISFARKIYENQSKLNK